MATSFQLVLDDTSPVVSYFPFPETLGVANLLAGWNSYFSGSGFLSQFGEIGQGTSMHVTGLDGAALTIQWTGTGISLFGSTFRSTYNVSIDGQPATLGTAQDGLLANVQGLDDQEHILELVAHPVISIDDSSYVAFDRAVLNVTIPVTGPDVFTEYIDVNNATLWHLIGDWEQVSGPLPDSAPFQGFRQSTTPGNLAEIFFQGSAVSVIGLRNTTTGRYNVTLDGNTTTLMGNSDWLETSTLFLQTGLDERVKHALTITNIDGPALGIAGLEITHVQGGVSTTINPSSINNGKTSLSLPVGTIVALVLGGVIALLIIGTLALCMWMRYRRKKLRARKFILLAKPVSSDDVDGVMEPLSSRDWNRDIEKEEPYPSTFPPRRPNLSVDVAMASSYTDTPRTRGGVDVVSGNAGRERKVKSVRITIPSTGIIPERIISPGDNSRDSRATFASLYEMLDPQPSAESSLPKAHADPQTPPPSSHTHTHKRSSLSSRRARYSRPRSISLGQRPLPSRLDIPQSQEGTSAPSGSQRGSTQGSLLMSPVRKPRRSRRSSLSAVEEASVVTVSTMDFVRPGRESAFSVVSPDVRQPLSFPVGTPAGDLLARLRAYREVRETTPALDPPP